MKKAFLILISLTFFTLFGCENDQSNNIVQYLNGVEVQYETQDQQQEIKQALNDMLNLDPDALRAKRYKNYEMEPGEWTAIDILDRYFVPATEVSIDSDNFYQNINKPETKKSIAKVLDDINTADDDY